MAQLESTGSVGTPHIRTYAAGVAGIPRRVAVMQGADDAHVIPATANAQCIGLMAEATVSVGDPAGVVCAGETGAVYGATVTANQYLISNATGQLVPSTAIGDQVIARAVSSGVANGGGIVFLTPFVR